MTTASAFASAEGGTKTIRVLRRNLNLSAAGDAAAVSLQWLIGSPFLPPITVASTLRCLHLTASGAASGADSILPDFSKEADDLRTLIIKGFDVIGALIVVKSGDLERIGRVAIEAARRMREFLGSNGVGSMVGGVVVDGDEGKVRFFVSESSDESDVERVDDVVYVEEAKAGREVWEGGCLVRCEVPIRLPVYVPVDKKADAEQLFLQTTDGLIAKLKDPKLTCILENTQNSSDNASRPVAIRGSDLDFRTDIAKVKLFDGSGEKSDVKSLSCSYFFPDYKLGSEVAATENADAIQATLMLNRSVSSSKSAAPLAEYYPALDEVRLLVVEYKLEVLCYAAKQLPLTYAVSKLIIPALTDQITTMKNAIVPSFLEQHPQTRLATLRAYHFCPPGFLLPITVIYELSYGETEIKQVEVRRSLHLRLGLPSDRPLLRVANALGISKGVGASKGSTRKGPYLLRDVHARIPSSGVSGGLVSLVQGSYEYYHYLQESFDDLGWGCAYRSLQTIISWFRLQHYTSLDVPTHREIQQTLVDIGDKDPSFIGSREWIGAIELSYVLDKLLGVICKVMNVRSGAELPEKCRELALHFENQGTPIMIGGGVLAYTLLGVDYNDVSGDCAFLILDPHYTGGEDLKKIVNGGWCGWKKAIDSKGKSFFLHDKFYNLLLPQRPNMV
ncbi:hypothetical protein Droror1_Dr00021381 [Drosera rotundifolia]